MAEIINNFSRLSGDDKILSLIKNINLPEDTGKLLEQLRIQQPDIQKIIEALSENVLTSFPSPYSIAPNFVINNRVYHIPFVTEESSVVAASAKAAKIWAQRGGFHAEVTSVIKTGQVHFLWKGDKIKLMEAFPLLQEQLLEQTASITDSMRKRGGGIRLIELLDKTDEIPGYFQLFVKFDTRNAMGANFINSCLEAMARTLVDFVKEHPSFTREEGNLEIIMSILSNYNPDCIVKTYVECPVRELEGISGEYSPADYARRFRLAADIARKDVYRAVTHNKGIFNGIDAVAIATGNDYRAIEAGAHAYASKSGQYRGLSYADISGDTFRFTLELPLTIGTVGGITSVHPLTQLSLKILGDPGAGELMMIMATAGLANNFAAVNALITSGIQKGHMKMHLSNILLQLRATDSQTEAAKQHFKDKVVSYSDVRAFIDKMN